MGDLPREELVSLSERLDLLADMHLLLIGGHLVSPCDAAGFLLAETVALPLDLCQLARCLIEAPVQNGVLFLQGGNDLALGGCLLGEGS